MKRFIKYTLGSLIGVSMFASCTGMFEEYNTSPITVNPDDLSLGAQFLEPMAYCYAPHQNMFQFWMNLNIDNYAGYFMTPNGNFSNGDLGENRGHSGGMYENFYLHIFNNTRRIIQNNEETMPGIAGVMRVVQVLGLEMTTDSYGPLAYSSILSGEYESWFPFDSQMQLYCTLFDELDKAEEQIENMSDSDKTFLKGADIWCAGDTDLWIKVINTLRLRNALKLSKRADEMKAEGYDLKAIAQAAAENTLANGGKDIVVTGQYNELRRMFDWGDTGANAFIITLMDGYKDPRLPLYFTKNTGDILYMNYSYREVPEKDKTEADKAYEKESGQKAMAYYYTNPDTDTPEAEKEKRVEKSEAVSVNKEEGYYGIRLGSGLPAKTNNWAPFSNWTGAENTPLPIFKQAESHFLLAEAALRNWINDDPKTHYENGIRTSIKNEATHNTNAKIADQNFAKDDANITAYLAVEDPQADFVDPVTKKLDAKERNDIAATVKVSVKWMDAGTYEEKLEQILTQKFIAVFPLSYVTWADSRRAGYPRLFPARVNKSNGVIDEKVGVRRLMYSDNAGTTNPQGLATGIELLQQETSEWKEDSGGTRLWWDVKDKGNFD